MKKKIKDLTLKECREVLKAIQDNFNLWVEPNYGVTLQFQQHTSMTLSEYEAIIKVFEIKKR